MAGPMWAIAMRGTQDDIPDATFTAPIHAKPAPYVPKVAGPKHKKPRHRGGGR